MYNRLKTKVLIGFGLLFCAPFVMGQDGVPYRIYNSKAKAVNFSKMSRDLKKADVVLFGEFHDNSLGQCLKEIINWI